MNNQLVSIIIPTYKRKDQLLKSLQTVINQSYKNIEIIVVDDNDDKDISGFISDSITKIKDSRIKLISYGTNKNGAYARNQGIINSKGFYIAFLDDDDFYDEYKIEKQVQFLNLHSNEFQAVYCKMDAHRAIKMPYAEGDLTLLILKQINILQTPSLMFTRSSLIDIKGFDENLLRHQDYDLMIRFFEKYKIGFLDEFLATQGPNDGSNILSGEKLESMKKYFLNKFDSNIKKFPLEIQKEIYLINYFSVMIQSIKSKDLKLILKYLILCLKTSPTGLFKKLLKFTLNKLGV